MEISFDTQSLRGLCEDSTKAAQKLGQVAAEDLKRRLADLRAAESIEDLVASPPTRLDDLRELSIQIADGFRLILRSNNLTLPMLDSKRVDWLAVDRIKVMRVEPDG